MSPRQASSRRAAVSPTPSFEKRRSPAPPGSIPDVLRMFESEVRFYQEVAPVVGVRVPRCFDASVTAEGTYLRLEDLSQWSPGADPAAVAAELRRLHDRWEGRALEQWPWLRRPGAAAPLIARAYEGRWQVLSACPELSPPVRRLGAWLVGRIEAAEVAEGTAGPLTLCHGNAALENVFTDSSGAIAFVDWEDVRCAAGVTDLAWLLVSSVPPGRWDEVIDAYDASADVRSVLASAAAQGLFILSGQAQLRASPAWGWMERLTEAAVRLDLV